MRVAFHAAIVYDASDVEGVMAGRAATILVIEDDLAIRDLLVDVLTDEGYRVRAAGDGEEALELLERWQPSLIILDRLMPRMDGAAFRTAQQARPTLATIPTILLSATRDLPAQAVALDATATMPKPFNLDELLALIARLLAAESAESDSAANDGSLPTASRVRRDDSGW